MLILEKTYGRFVAIDGMTILLHPFKTMLTTHVSMPLLPTNAF
jgi:hypothetical protein